MTYGLALFFFGASVALFAEKVALGDALPTSTYVWYDIFVIQQLVHAALNVWSQHTLIGKFLWGNGSLSMAIGLVGVTIHFFRFKDDIDVKTWMLVAFALCFIPVLLMYGWRNLHAALSDIEHRYRPIAWMLIAVSVLGNPLTGLVGHWPRKAPGVDEPVVLFVMEFALYSLHDDIWTCLSLVGLSLTQSHAHRMMHRVGVFGLWCASIVDGWTTFMQAPQRAWLWFVTPVLHSILLAYYPTPDGAKQVSVNVRTRLFSLSRLMEQPLLVLLACFELGMVAVGIVHFQYASFTELLMYSFHVPPFLVGLEMSSPHPVTHACISVYAVVTGWLALVYYSYGMHLLILANAFRSFLGVSHLAWNLSVPRDRIYKQLKVTMVQLYRKDTVAARATWVLVQALTARVITSRPDCDASGMAFPGKFCRDDQTDWVFRLSGPAYASVVHFGLFSIVVATVFPWQYGERTQFVNQCVWANVVWFFALFGNGLWIGAQHKVIAYLLLWASFAWVVVSTPALQISTGVDG